MDDITLEQLIRQYVQLPTVASGTGWFPVLHSCDHGRKGPRAGFKFDGDAVAFHCFNCNLKAVYNPAEYPYLSKDMKQVMEDFGIPDGDWQRVQFKALGQTPQKSTSSKPTGLNEPKEQPLPATFYKLSEAQDDDKWAEIARYYLEDRGIDPNSYDFMLSKKTDVDFLKKWFGRVIIPIYKDEKLIFYIGRDLTEKAVKKYESPAVTRENVIFGFDKLFEQSDLPLYIVEGWFDAHVVDGIAILGNELSDGKIRWINRSRRKKVYVPDQFGSGAIAAHQAIDAGWHISTPEIGNCKDLNDAVQKYGKLYVMQTLAEQTSVSEFDAKAKVGVFCKT